MMMIMRMDRQDFDEVTDHMNLRITFIGLMVLCQQKASHINKFLSAAYDQILCNKIKIMPKTKVKSGPRLKCMTMSKFMFLTIL